jgi:UDP-glucuronate 4-epimerase
MKILVTGAAGFIGSHVMGNLHLRGDDVIGIDNFNNYYDVSLKKDRIKVFSTNVYDIDVSNAEALNRLFSAEKFQRVIHLAAQAGVRYSLDNPSAYIQSNLIGFANILEACRNFKIEHLVYASSSSVYGLNSTMPFMACDPTNHPASLYAATKKSNELMAHSYSHLFNIPTTGLRFFTVYGPWGRPDMAPMLFAKAIINGDTIKVFNHGDMKRDFTFIDDIAKGVILALDKVATPDINWNSKCPSPNASSAPYRIYNIGNNKPVPLLDFIGVLENSIGMKAKIDLLPLQPGDVKETASYIDDFTAATGYLPTTSIEVGIPRFVNWYKFYYKL